MDIKLKHKIIKDVLNKKINTSCMGFHILCIIMSTVIRINVSYISL